MKKYWSFFRIRFANTLQYRAAALAGIATQFAWGFMTLLMFQAFYRTDPSSMPMSMDELVSYEWLQQAFLALFMAWFFDNEILESIRSGNIAYQLVRPINLYGMWFLQNLAGRTAKALLRSAPILLIAAFLPEPFRLGPPADGEALLFFLLTMALSLCVMVAFSMLIYLSAFYTLSANGLRQIAIVAVDFLQGAVIPLPFWPDGLRRVAEFLPFASMQNLPLRIYSGNIAGAELWNAVLLQIFWLAVLLVTGKFFMKSAIKRTVVQGG